MLTDAELEKNLRDAYPEAKEIEIGCHQDAASMRWFVIANVWLGTHGVMANDYVDDSGIGSVMMRHAVPLVAVRIQEARERAVQMILDKRAAELAGTVDLDDVQPDKVIEP